MSEVYKIHCYNKFIVYSIHVLCMIIGITLRIQSISELIERTCCVF